MRRLAWLLVLGVVGCASWQQQARLQKRAEREVARALDATSPELRLQAARIAADVADPQLDRALTARLGDRAATVRATAAVALARQAQVAADVLRAVLTGDDAAARAIALDGVGALPDAPELLARLTADRSPDVRAGAATALARLRGAEVRPCLRALAHDGDAGVRARAITALAALGERGLVGDVAAGLDDPALAVRLAALGALVRLGRDELGQRLLALGAGSDRYLALRAAVQLSRAGRSAPALATVQAAADDRDPAVRVAAMNAAGELGSDGAALAVARLADADLDVRMAAARARVR
jgi:HEAT repeat protein